MLRRTWSTSRCCSSPSQAPGAGGEDADFGDFGDFGDAGDLGEVTAAWGDVAACVLESAMISSSLMNRLNGSRNLNRAGWGQSPVKGMGPFIIPLVGLSVCPANRVPFSANIAPVRKYTWFPVASGLALPLLAAYGSHMSSTPANDRVRAG